MESSEVVARGYFWIESVDAPVAGELKYAPSNGTTLYLFGALEDFRLDDPGTGTSPLFMAIPRDLGGFIFSTQW